MNGRPPFQGVVIDIPDYDLSLARPKQLMYDRPSGLPRTNNQDAPGRTGPVFSGSLDPLAKLEQHPIPNPGPANQGNGEDCLQNDHGGRRVETGK